MINALRQLHGIQLGWRTWVRVLWWLLLLPLALACWAAVQQTTSRQIGAWALAALALIFFIASATTSGSKNEQIAAGPSAPTTVTNTTTDASTATDAPQTASVEPSPPSGSPVQPSPPPVPSPVVPAPVITHTTAAPPALPPPAPAPPAPVGAQVFANCAALNAIYPHGVGLPGAVDHVSGSSKPVTTFTRSTALYEANTARDRDGDGIACEQA